MLCSDFSALFVLRLFSLSNVFLVLVVCQSTMVVIRFHMGAAGNLKNCALLTDFVALCVLVAFLCAYSTVVLCNMCGVNIIMCFFT